MSGSAIESGSSVCSLASAAMPAKPNTGTTSTKHCSLQSAEIYFAVAFKRVPGLCEKDWHRSPR